MTDDHSNGEAGEAAAEKSPPWGLFLFSMAAFCGLGWGLLAALGYYWPLVDFATAPTWSVIAAFVAMPFASILTAFAVGDGSVIEIGIKTVIVGVAAWLSWGRPWLDPVLLAVGCGLVAMLLVGGTARLFGIKD